VRNSRNWYLPTKVAFFGPIFVIFGVLLAITGSAVQGIAIAVIGVLCAALTILFVRAGAAEH
jgi:hypothetical protein